MSVARVSMLRHLKTVFGMRALTTGSCVAMETVEPFHSKWQNVPVARFSQAARRQAGKE